MSRDNAHCVQAAREGRQKWRSNRGSDLVQGFMALQALLFCSVSRVLSQPLLQLPQLLLVVPIPLPSPTCRLLSQPPCSLSVIRVIIIFCDLLRAHVVKPCSCRPEISTNNLYTHQEAPQHGSESRSIWRRLLIKAAAVQLDLLRTADQSLSAGGPMMIGKVGPPESRIN